MRGAAQTISLLVLFATLVTSSSESDLAPQESAAFFANPYEFELFGCDVACTEQGGYCCSSSYPSCCADRAACCSEAYPICCPGTSYCCAEGKTCCGSYCCGSDSYCVSGQCVTPSTGTPSSGPYGAYYGMRQALQFSKNTAKLCDGFRGTTTVGQYFRVNSSVVWQKPVFGAIVVTVAFNEGNSCLSMRSETTDMQFEKATWESASVRTGVGHDVCGDALGGAGDAGCCACTGDPEFDNVWDQFFHSALFLPISFTAGLVVVTILAGMACNKLFSPKRPNHSETNKCRGSFSTMVMPNGLHILQRPPVRQVEMAPVGRAAPPAPPPARPAPGVLQIDPETRGQAWNYDAMYANALAQELRYAPAAERIASPRQRPPPGVSSMIPGRVPIALQPAPPLQFMPDQRARPEAAGGSPLPAVWKPTQGDDFTPEPSGLFTTMALYTKSEASPQL